MSPPAIRVAPKPRPRPAPLENMCKCGHPASKHGPQECLHTDKIGRFCQCHRFELEPNKTKRSGSASLNGTVRNGTEQHKTRRSGNYII